MDKKKVLITGATGFVGPHLTDLLLRQGNFEIFGTYLDPKTLPTLAPFGRSVQTYEMDLTNQKSVEKIITQTRPDFIFHLAAQSNVAQSWEKPAQTFDVNVLGTIYLFEAVKKLQLDPVIQVACSSEQYGLVPANQLPVNEETGLNPLSPYAVSRIAIDLLSYQYYKSYNMKIVRTRAFNHTGPGQSDQFVCSRFAKKIAEIEKGLTPPVIKVGNLNAIRDFTDVRDMVRAYALSVKYGKPGEAYIIASGIGRSIKDILDILLSASRLSINIETDPALLRPSDIPALYGDSNKFRKATGWNPDIPLEKTLHDLLEYWREHV